MSNERVDDGFGCHGWLSFFVIFFCRRCMDWLMI